jgi:hypothetical protein
VWLWVANQHADPNCCKPLAAGARFEAPATKPRELFNFGSWNRLLRDLKVGTIVAGVPVLGLAFFPKQEGRIASMMVWEMI